jgi:hypothetical protein
MDQRREAWRKEAKENAESAEIGGFRRMARAILSTFSGPGRA